VTITAEREVCLRAVEFRATGDSGNDGRTLEGYAAVFGKATMICSWEGDFEEEIAPGAFRKTLRKSKPVMQFDHGRDMRTGSVPIGSIEELAEDETGLFVRGRLFDNEIVEPIRQAIEGQAITGMSFRFQVAREEWRDNKGTLIKADELAKLLWEPGDRSPLKRTITEIDPLYELGPVVFPAYDATSVGVRSLLAQLPADERRELVREVVAELRRDPGLTDLAGRPDARRAGGSDAPKAEPDAGRRIPHSRQLLDDGALRVRGITR
jgi:phage prohead protease, HK97 family